MEKINITNQNRDLRYNRGKHLWFEPVESKENTYTLHSDLDYLLEYACINYDEVKFITDADFVSIDQFGNSHMGKIHSYDPSGGPYMSVGNYTINGKVLKRIYQTNKQYYFETEC